MKKKIDWEKIKEKAVKNCFNCGSYKSYSNPFEKCEECKKKFCFDCLWGGQYRKDMGENDELKTLCDKCKKAGGYKSLREL